MTTTTTLVTVETKIHTLTTQQQTIFVADNTRVNIITVGTQGPAGAAAPHFDIIGYTMAKGV